MDIARQNNAIDCLQMELTPVPAATGDNNQFDLYLTLKCGSQWEEFLNGRVEFGIKGGILEIVLENAEFSNIPSPEYENEEIEIISPEATTSPSWKISAQPGTFVLQTDLENVKLGTVQVNNSSYRLTTKLTVSASDVSVTHTEGLWKHDLSPNKHALLERKLARFLLENKLTPYLSQVTLTENDSTENQPKTERKPLLTLEKLQTEIEQIIASKTNNFAELANIVHLNLQSELAGGNLLGVDLSNLDLSGANLMAANLRGADLSDADLSEANLSRAKLSGADLSGAYLSNADLSHANLQRASLALANLSGATLQGANLLETNFSNTNLSSTNLEGAKFGNNAGMTEEMRENFTSQGH